MLTKTPKPIYLKNSNRESLVLEQSQIINVILEALTLNEGNNLYQAVESTYNLSGMTKQEFLSCIELAFVDRLVQLD